ADDAPRDGAHSEKSAVFAFLGELACWSEDEGEGDHAAEDAGHRELWEQQLGALDLGVSVEPEVDDDGAGHDEVEGLVLDAAQGEEELGPAPAEPEPDGVECAVHDASFLESSDAVPWSRGGWRMRAR